MAQRGVLWDPLYAADMDKRELLQNTIIRPKPQSLEPSGITIGWCTAGATDNVFTDSLSASHVYDKFYGGCRIWSTISAEGGPRIVETRSQVVEAFLNQRQLAHPVSGEMPQWLAMIDTDMSWEPDAIHRLVTIAEEGDAGDPIHLIGGLCFAGGRTHLTPTVYREYLDDDGTKLVEPMYDYPRDALVKCGATGAAFMIVHREVLHKMFEAFKTARDGYPNPHPWFVEGARKGKQFGEDIAFCLRASAIGYPTYVHTGVKTGHMKRSPLNEALYDDTRATG